MDLLDDNTILEIFFKLPISSLMSCRRVCRLWRELIREDYFIRTYTSRSLKGKKNLMIHIMAFRSKYFFVDRRHDSIPTCLPLRFSFHNLTEFNIIGSCNGLLCLVSRANQFIKFVCNPFLGEFIKIPLHVYPRGGQIVSLDCEFGFCLKTQSYKVLEVARWSVKSRYWYEVYVYRLGDSHWKRVHSEPHEWLPQWNSASLVNDALHWVSRISSETLCVFELADDKFKTIPGPVAIGTRFSSGVLGNCLSIMSTYGDHVDVWLMKQYGDGESWEKSFDINLSQMNSNVDLVRVIDCPDDDELFISYVRQFGSYNLQLMEFKKMDIVGYQNPWFNFVIHSDTLISPLHL